MSKALAALLAAAALASALTLALHHPLWPYPAALACLLWSALLLWRPLLWLFAVPLGAACLNLAPWTGWIVWDEFDLLLLASLAGGYAARWRAPHALPLPLHLRWLLLALGALALLGLGRGLADAMAMAAIHGDSSTLRWDWFAGYTHALNSLRVAKAELYALLLLPLLHAASPVLSQVPPVSTLSRGLPPAQRYLAGGMLAGLSVVVLALLWERLAFAGLLDFSQPYRTVALFWEMHVGGEALDAYLALATPFAAWAVLAARRPLPWLAAALLATLAGYAALTTFSRGVYGAVLAALVLLLVLRQLQGTPLQGWRARAANLLVLVLLAEAALVLGAGSYMRQRLRDTPGDLNSRLQHWQRGQATLQSPTDWLLGLGTGRLPAHYAHSGPAGEWSGAVQAQRQPDAHPPLTFVTLRGPATRKSLAGQFALVQRLSAPGAQPQPLRMRLRVQDRTDLQVQWCARHLLYSSACLEADLRVAPQGGQWQTVHLTLQPQPARKRLGPTAERSAAPPDQGRWRAPQLAFFSIAVAQAAAAVDIAEVQLLGPPGTPQLANADFAQGLAQWLGAAQSYFLPWHIDNLVLEMLLERGLLGLLCLYGLLLAALWLLCAGPARQGPLAPCQAAALLGALCVGLSGSVLDVPRVSTLLYLLALDALLQAARSATHALHAKSQQAQIAAAQTACNTLREPWA